MTKLIKLFSIITVILLITASCSGTYKTKKIGYLSLNETVVDLILEHDVILNPGKYAGGNVTFVSKHNISEIKNEIETHNEVDVELYHEKYLLIRDDKNNFSALKEIYYEKNKYYYHFGDMRCSIIYDISDDNGTVYENIIFPYHYIVESEEKVEISQNSQIYARQPYQTYKGLNDFFEFYNSLNIYDIAKDKDALILSNLPNPNIKNIVFNFDHENLYFRIEVSLI